MTSGWGHGQVAARYDTVVAAAAADTVASTIYVSFFSGTCGSGSLLASALLCVVSTGCFNPNLIGHPLPLDNHVPVVEVLPRPTLTPLDAVVDGAQVGCAPLQLEIITLKDSDGDTLTVNYDIIVNREGTEIRQNLKTTPPILASDDGTYPLPNNTGLDLNRNTLAQVGDLRQQTEADAEIFQLIELRVSDNGFDRIDGVPIPRDGGGLFTTTWNVKLSPCIGTAP